jgi:excisionase family DNA binding protein
VQPTGTPIRCPNCGHTLATVDLPTTAAVIPPASGDPNAAILLRVAAAAPLLSVSRSTVYQLIAKGEIPIIRIGSSIRIPRAALERMAAG